MKKLMALLVIGCFAGSVIAQNAPQQKGPAGPVQKDKEKDKDHHRHHHHREHKQVK